MPPAFEVAPVSVAVSLTDAPIAALSLESRVASVGLAFPTVSTSDVQGLTVAMFWLSPE